MSLQVAKETDTVYDPIFLQILEDIQGGITVNTGRIPTNITEVEKGAMLQQSASSVGFYEVIKTARLTAALVSNVTVMLVEPANHLFKAGDYISVNIGEDAAQTIAAVYPATIVLAEAGVSHMTVPVSSEVVECGAAAASGSATPLYVADCILRANIQVRDADETARVNVFAGAVVRGTVNESILPYFVTSADKTALTARLRFA